MCISPSSQNRVDAKNRLGPPKLWISLNYSIFDDRPRCWTMDSWSVLNWPCTSLEEFKYPRKFLRESFGEEKRSWRLLVWKIGLMRLFRFPLEVGWLCCVSSLQSLHSMSPPNKLLLEGTTQLHFQVMDLHNNNDCQKEDSIPFIWVLWIFIGLLIVTVVVVIAFFIMKARKRKMPETKNQARPTFWNELEWPIKDLIC